ncbi:uncharacterized protein LOC119093468 [Pollicipes pollicipes]|uniref:uncharacterized protein LOC119093468 n=1 Tax=Pollicipes pollicipes TaxID=41117 RepID=UPI00188559A8|nr:uncharacterized protein LOC119093468 [Pollicipes pollicipes]
MADDVEAAARSGDEKLPLYAAMLFFNAIKGSGELTVRLLARDDFGSVAAALLTLVSRDSEFALFGAEELCSADLARVYTAVPAEHRPLLLDIALSACERDRLALPLEAALFVKERFRALAEPLLTAAVALLEAVVRLLRAVHELGSADGTAFSTLAKLAELEEAGDDAVSAEPTFGLKAQLVRLLGNLVWRRPDAQHAARRLGAVPVVLECCNLDARNPLLQQWAVVAVRHLCEACLENQAAIRELELQGLAPEAAEELRQMGVTTVREAGRIRMRPAQR